MFNKHSDAIKTVVLAKFAARHALVCVLTRNFARWHHNYVNLVLFCR